jgi:DUF1680 family protein
MPMFKTDSIVRIALMVLTISSVSTASPTAPSRKLTPFGRVTMRGELGARFNAATANLLTRQDRYSLDSYKSNASGIPGAALWPDWPGDQFGRMFSVMHVAEGYGFTPATSLRESVGSVILPCQTKLGNFGQEKPLDQKDARIISGNAFALRGLMDAFEDTGDSRYLDSARKLARYYEATFGAWKDNGKGILHEFYGHCIDGLVRLYELGGDQWALDLAKKAAERTGRTNHTHHSLSMYRGVIDLSRVTGETKFLGHAEDYLQWCRENRIVSGGLSESMPKSEQDEGCALADYIVVNLMMFQATGRDGYLDDAEHTLVNHFFMNQFHTGGFGHRQFAIDLIGGKQWQGWDGRFGSENPGCCSMWGQWALAQLGQYILTRDGEAVEVNLYPSAAIDIPELAARIEIRSDFPRMSRVGLTVHCDKPFKCAIRFRVPAWAEGLAMKLNSEDATRQPQDRRVVLDREWHSGDRVEIAFKSSLKLVPWPDKAAATAAVFDGPLCLAISSATADVDAFNHILISPDGKLDLSRDGRPQAANNSGAIVTSFRPIAEDWLSPNLKNPNRLRVLFTKQAR